MVFLFCFITSPHLWSVKETGIHAPRRWLFWGVSLPSSESAGFLNKVVFLVSTPLSRFVGLLCGKQSKLGLSNRASCWEWQIIDRVSKAEPLFSLFLPTLTLKGFPPSQVLPKHMPPVNLLPKLQPQEFLVTGDRQMSWEVWLDAGALGKCPLTASLAWACFTCPPCLFISIWSEGKCTEWQKQPWKHISGADWKSNESLYIYTI